MAEQTRGGGRMVVGMILVGLGVLFLMFQVFGVVFRTFPWPLIIVVVGLLFYGAMLAGGRAAGPLAVPGSIVSVVGLILLYDVISAHWESWAYTWALVFPGAVGIGLIIHGMWTHDLRARRNGWRWFSTGLVIFIVAGTLFELLFFGGAHGLLSRYLWPLLMVGVGIFLIFRRGTRRVSAPVSRTVSPPPAPAVKTEPSAPTAKIDPRPASPVTGFQPLDAGAEGKRPSRRKAEGGEPRE